MERDKDGGVQRARRTRIGKSRFSAADVSRTIHSSTLRHGSHSRLTCICKGEAEPMSVEAVPAGRTVSGVTAGLDYGKSEIL